MELEGARSHASIRPMSAASSASRTRPVALDSPGTAETPNRSPSALLSTHHGRSLRKSASSVTSGPSIERARSGTRLLALHDARQLGFFRSMAPLAERRAFLHHLSPARKKRWVVYAKMVYRGGCISPL